MWIECTCAINKIGASLHFAANDAERLPATPESDPIVAPQFDCIPRHPDSFCFLLQHDAYVFEVKKPEESRYPGDFYKLRATIPAEEAFRPLKDGGCPLVKG
jgi:hypothetical protein